VLFDELVAQVGAERYREACRQAWSSAAGTGRCGGARSWPGDVAFVPHEFSDMWWGDAAPAQCLDTALRLYREMPCYANTIELKRAYERFGDDEKQTLWNAFRDVLACDDDRLADPLGYALWVDFFEDPATVEESWREMTGRDGDAWERRIERVLDNAGPVPWPLKEELFAQLVRDRRFHHAIFRALAGSAFDVYGQLGPSAASWLQRLQLAPDTPDLPALRVRLGVRG
jgi:hypothetical protein